MRLAQPRCVSRASRSAPAQAMRGFRANSREPKVPGCTRFQAARLAHAHTSTPRRYRRGRLLRVICRALARRAARARRCTQLDSTGRSSRPQPVRPSQVTASTFWSRCFCGLQSAPLSASRCIGTILVDGIGFGAFLRTPCCEPMQFISGATSSLACSRCFAGS